MSKNYFLDFETLGTADNSVILSVGFLYIPENVNILKLSSCKELEKYGLYFKLDRTSQINLGRKYSKSTVDWWQKQGSDAKEVISNTNLVTCETFHLQLKNLLNITNFDKKNDIVWSRGMIDERWMASLFRDFELEELIPFYLFRDTRTAVHILSGDAFFDVPKNYIKDYNKLVKHNALHDCILDAYKLAYLLQEEENDDYPF